MTSPCLTILEASIYQHVAHGYAPIELHMPRIQDLHSTQETRGSHSLEERTVTIIQALHRQLSPAFQSSLLSHILAPLPGTSIMPSPSSNLGVSLPQVSSLLPPASAHSLWSSLFTCTVYFGPPGSVNLGGQPHHPIQDYLLVWLVVTEKVVGLDEIHTGPQGESTH